MSIKPGTNYTVTRKGIGGLESVTKDPFGPNVIGRTLLGANTFVQQTATIANGDYTVQADHGLTTGDPVLYHSMGGVPILNNSDHSVTTNDVDVVNNAIKVTAHGFKTGTRLYYTNGSGASITGLSETSNGTGANSYYVIKVNDNYFKLATTFEGAHKGVDIDISGTGNDDQDFKVYFDDFQTFYVSNRSGQPTHFYLHATKALALGSDGSGSNRIVISDANVGNDNQVIFSPFGALSPAEA